MTNSENHIAGNNKKNLLQQLKAGKGSLRPPYQGLLAETDTEDPRPFKQI